ncbi:hypothetical protein ACTWP5_17670 [Streptomyces sp. 4N509B]|uniref:hypothetical protein n=1 Tax=Streptomyces sp. 4N509B TaxID=3457413 RepID=UPI003FD4E4F3
MTHQLRLPMAERLRDQLRRRHPGLQVRVACDTAPPGERGSLRSAQLAWSAAGRDATHHVVLQDDVRLPGDFLGALHAVVACRPDEVTSLFVEWGAWTASVVRLAALTGAGWAEVVDDYVPTQAVVMPAAVARAVGEHLRGELSGGAPDDVALHRHLLATGRVPHVAVPNLVEHRDAASLTGNHPHGLRCAACWLGDAPAGGVDTGRAVTGVDAVPVMAWWGRPGCYVRMRDATAPEGWRKVPALPALAWFGLSEREVGEAGAAAVNGPDRATVAARGLLGEELLFELWLAAFLLGVRAAQLTPASGPAGAARAVAARVDTPLARRALTTMPLGAVRNLVPRHRLARAAAVLTPLVRRAVLLGAGSGRGPGG